MEMVGGDAIDGRDGASEDVIGAMELLSLFNSIDIQGFFYDEDGGLVSPGVAIKGGNFFVGVN